MVMENVNDITCDGLFSYHTFELNKVITNEDYRLIRNTTYRHAETEKFACYEVTKNMFISEEFTKAGVVISIINADNKPYIFKLRINPRRLLGDNSYIGIYRHDDICLIRLIEKINEILLHIGVDWDFESMLLSRLDLCVNKRFENLNEAETYMRLINKSYVPAEYKKVVFAPREVEYKKKNKSSYRITNGMRTITIYDKKYQLKTENLIGDDDDINNIIGLLRFEVSLNSRAIKEWSGDIITNKEKLEFFFINSKKIMMSTFLTLFDPMPFFRYGLTLDMIKKGNDERIITDSVCKKMNQLVESVSSSKNLNAAFDNDDYFVIKNYKKKIKYKQVKKVMEGFYKLGFNPITLKNRDTWISLPSVIQLLN